MLLYCIIILIPAAVATVTAGPSQYTSPGA